LEENNNLTSIPKVLLGSGVIAQYQKSNFTDGLPIRLGRS